MLDQRDGDPEEDRVDRAGGEDGKLLSVHIVALLVIVAVCSALAVLTMRLLTEAFPEWFDG